VIAFTHRRTLLERMDQVYLLQPGGALVRL
jgi:hypothetical protein